MCGTSGTCRAQKTPSAGMGGDGFRYSPALKTLAKWCGPLESRHKSCLKREYLLPDGIIAPYTDLFNAPCKGARPVGCEFLFFDRSLNKTPCLVLSFEMQKPLVR